MMTMVAALLDLLVDDDRLVVAGFHLDYLPRAALAPRSCPKIFSHKACCLRWTCVTGQAWRIRLSLDIWALLYDFSSPAPRWRSLPPSP